MRFRVTLYLAAALLAVIPSVGQSAQYPPGPAGSCPDTLSIVTLQNAVIACHPAAGDTIYGVGGIITAADNIPTTFAFYIQRSQGGAYSGIQVFTGATNRMADLGLSVGDSVVVEAGKTNELSGGSQIVSVGASPASLILRKVSSGHPLPAFFNGTTSDFKESNANALAETYEGCLVRLTGPVQVARSGGALGTNNFLVVASGSPADSVFIDGSSLTTVSAPPIGSSFNEIRGVLDQRTRGYRIQLRSSSDLPPLYPVPILAHSLSGNIVRVVFDRSVTAATAQNIANYSLDSFGSVNSAVLSGGTVVQLNITNGLSAGDDEGISITGITSQSGGITMPFPVHLSFVNGVITCAQAQQMKSAFNDSSVFTGRTCTVRAVCSGSNSVAQFTTVAYLEDAAGGSFSGIAVTGLPATIGLGDDMTLVGTIREVQGRTTLDSIVFLQTNGTASVPAPQLLTPADLKAGSQAGTPVNRGGLVPEPWECVLVRVTNDTVVTANLPPAQWFLRSGPDSCLVSDVTPGLGYQPNPGDQMTLTGICDPSGGPYAIRPRMPSDLLIVAGAPIDSLRWRRLLFSADANIRTVQSLANNFFAEHQEFDDQDEGDWKFYQRWLSFWEPRTDSTASYRAADIALHQFMAGNPPLTTNGTERTTYIPEGKWQPLGPFVTPTPENSYMSVGMGHILALNINPVNTAEIYAGSNSGGIWRTVNGGLSWAHLNATIYTSGVQDIAVDYSTSPRTIYIATGVTTYGKNYGFGVMKSCDGGVTWNCASPGLGQDPSIAEIPTIRLVLNPTNSSELYAVTSTTLYHSTDGGDNWSTLFTSSGDDFKDLELLPGAFNNLFVGGKTLWRYDGTSTDLTSILTSAIFSATSLNVTIVRIELASVPGNPATLYAMVATSTGADILLKSTNKGAAWTWISTQNGVKFGYWDLAMAISTADPNVIYQAGVPVYKSTNGGVTYNIVSNGSAATSTYVHDDARIIWLKPGSSTEVYVGHDGGVSKSLDGGATWTDISAGLVVGQPYGIATSIDNQAVFLGNQDKGIERYDVAVDSWKQPQRVGDAYNPVVDPLDPNIAYLTSNGSTNDISKTINKGHSWSNLPTPAGLCNLARPMLLDPQDNTKLVIGYHDVFRLDVNNVNSGWTQLSHFDADFAVSNLGRMQAIAIAPSNHDVMYVCYSGAAWNFPSAVSKFVFKTTNATAANPTWEDITANFKDGNGYPVYWDLGITALLVHPQNPNTVWAAFGGYKVSRVMKSTDGGKTWVNVSQGLPLMPVNCLEFERGGDDGIYAGTDVGVYYRDENMSSWLDYSGGMGRMIVSDLDINYASNRLRAAAFGRGAWESPLFNSYSSVNAPDGFIRDSYDDQGNQPNTQTGGILWASPDIWVRNTADTPDAFSPPFRYAHENQHEDPQYTLGDKPRVYTRVVNRGQQPVSGTVQLYWAQASTGLTWPDSWTNGTTGEVVGPAAATPISLQPGQVWVVERQWNNMPDPDTFGDQHFCLLARFVADAGDALVPEGSNVWVNTQQNNNIAWKNVTVLPLVHKKEAGLLMRNGRVTAATLSLQFSVPVSEAGDPFLAHGDFEVDLGPTLYSRWVANGSGGTGIVPNGGTKIRIVNAAATITGLTFAAGESQRILPAFQMQDTSCALAGRTFRVEVAQFANGSPTPDGGEEYVVSAADLPCQVVSVPDGTADLPLRAYLAPGRPNPMSRSTAFGFGLPRPGPVEIRIYDISGRVVRSLANERFSAGKHDVKWDGRDRNGQRVRSGVYFCEMRTGDDRLSRRIIVVP